MKISFAINITISISRIKNLGVKVEIYLMMFELKELKLMFLDPTDLVINNINKFLRSKRAINFIFS